MQLRFRSTGTDLRSLKVTEGFCFPVALGTEGGAKQNTARKKGGAGAEPSGSGGRALRVSLVPSFTAVPPRVQASSSDKGDLLYFFLLLREKGKFHVLIEQSQVRPQGPHYPFK